METKVESTILGLGYPKPVQPRPRVAVAVILLLLNTYEGKKYMTGRL